jgi:hypothetical protein
VDFTAINLMPKIRRAKLPEALLLHLLARVRQRNISHEQIIFLARWLDTEPEVSDGKWFKKFPGMTVCGESELIKTFLLPGQIATGKEIN